MVKPSTDWLTHVADTKRVNYGEKAAFRVKIDGIRAFLQAKAATPARSKIAHKLWHSFKWKAHGVTSFLGIYLILSQKTEKTHSFL